MAWLGRAVFWLTIAHGVDLVASVGMDRVILGERDLLRKCELALCSYAADVDFDEIGF